jgi:hypothetical protein
MNALHQEVEDLMGTLFQRYPALCGFLVKEDLSFSYVSCHPVLAGEQAEELINEISATLHALAEEQPAAADLLRGRTLARVFH